MPESEVCTPQLAISGRLPNRSMQAVACAVCRAATRPKVGGAGKIFHLFFNLKCAKYRRVAGKLMMQIDPTTTALPRKSQYLSQKMPASAPKVVRSTIALKFG
ncbi:MAG TPA: hypothetical protein VMM15_34280 [Bradyrhizobium sp.]|nr:hypothetical protein [Bradyrhizobium sp.]